MNTTVGIARHRRLRCAYVRRSRALPPGGVRDLLGQAGRRPRHAHDLAPRLAGVGRNEIEAGRAGRERRGASGGPSSRWPSLGPRVVRCFGGAPREGTSAVAPAPSPRARPRLIALFVPPPPIREAGGLGTRACGHPGGWPGTTRRPGPRSAAGQSCLRRPGAGGGAPADRAAGTARPSGPKRPGARAPRRPSPPATPTRRRPPPRPTRRGRRA